MIHNNVSKIDQPLNMLDTRKNSEAKPILIESMAVLLRIYAHARRCKKEVLTIQ
jgi:hypothetical protein